MPTKGDAEAAKREFRRAAARGLLACAALAQAEEMKALAKSYPPASREGQHPALRTGNLQSAVDYEPKSVDEVARTLRVTVGYQRRAWYIVPLVVRGRLWLADTARRIRPQLAALFAKVAGGSGGNAGDA